MFSFIFLIVKQSIFELISNILEDFWSIASISFGNSKCKHSTLNIRFDIATKKEIMRNQIWLTNCPFLKIYKHWFVWSNHSLTGLRKCGAHHLALKQMDFGVHRDFWQQFPEPVSEWGFEEIPNINHQSDFPWEISGEQYDFPVFLSKHLFSQDVEFKLLEKFLYFKYRIFRLVIIFV